MIPVVDVGTRKNRGHIRSKEKDFNYRDEIISVRGIVNNYLRLNGGIAWWSVCYASWSLSCFVFHLMRMASLSERSRDSVMSAGKKADTNGSLTNHANRLFNFAEVLSLPLFNNNGPVPLNTLCRVAHLLTFPTHRTLKSSFRDSCWAGNEWESIIDEWIRTAW